MEIARAQLLHLVLSNDPARPRARPSWTPNGSARRYSSFEVAGWEVAGFIDSC
jgi:hypothetical protein